MAEQDIILLPEALRSIDTATFTGSYQALGTPIAHGVRILKFTNNSNVDATISWNGTVDHEILPAGSFLLLDIATNKQLTSACWVSIGTQFYVKGSAGTGSVYLSIYYA